VTPTLKVLKGQAPNMLVRRGRQNVAQTKMPMRGGMAMPSLPALRQKTSDGRRAHYLTSDLRTPVGRRQAALWREVFGPPRSLQPM
ncbi:MAG: hypothetical protein LC725_07575, partial [Lentisphaerae bacterium]|nr:hypothetical protein [Lentisphaerota bacterium]